MEPNDSEGSGGSLDAISSNHGPTILLVAVLVNIVPASLLRFVGGNMYLFFIVLFLWSAFYILTIALAIKLEGLDCLGVLGLSSRLSIPLLLILSAIPRLAWIGSEVIISLDAVWYIDFGKFMSWGDMPYADFYFPYPPVFGYFIYAIMVIAPSIDSYRILAVIFDVAIVGMLAQMVRSRVIKNEMRIAPLVYAVLPFAVIESGFNGHFEPIANIFLLGAIWCILKHRIRIGGVLLGLSAATKVYAVFLLPLFFLIIPQNRKRLELIVVSALAGYLTFIPFSIPVWMRGDLLPPGTAMPGLQTGFFDALFGFLLNLSFLNKVSILLVASSVAILTVVFIAKSFTESRFRPAIIYDIMTASIGALLGLMVLFLWFYPLVPPGPGVFWRYPTDIGIARGASTVVGTLMIVWMTWRRWRDIPIRPTSNAQLVLAASVVLLLLLTLLEQVFYGWYLLWVLPPLFFIRDRRLVYLVLACMLLIYPSYTHDNFLSLGFEESKTWSNELSSVTGWESNVNLTNTNLTPGEIDAEVESLDGIGAFSVDSSGVANQTELQMVEIEWTTNVSIPVTPQTEFVLLISSDWDPTFKKSCMMALYFDGLNATGYEVSWPLIDTWQFSPTNLTYILWRFTFSGQSIQVHPVEITRLRLVVNEIQERDFSIFIDFMYTTEVILISPTSFLFAVALTIPNALAVLVLSRILPRNLEWYIEDESAEVSTA